MGDLVRRHADTKVTDAIVLISRVFAQRDGERVWIGRVPSNRYIADLPTRNVDPPPPTKAVYSFVILSVLKELVTARRKDSDFPRPYGPVTKERSDRAAFEIRPLGTPKYVRYAIISPLS